MTGPHDWRPWKRRALAYGPLTLAVALLAQRAIVARAREARARGGGARRRLHPLPVRPRHRRGAPAALPGGRALHERRDEHARGPPRSRPSGPRRARGRHPLAGVGASRSSRSAASRGRPRSSPHASRGARRRSARARWSSRSARSRGAPRAGWRWCRSRGSSRGRARRAAEFAEDAPSARTPAASRRARRARVGRRPLPPRGRALALFVGRHAGRVPASGRRGATRLLALAAGAAVLALPLLLLVLTGSARSNTAVAKLLPGNPYYAGPALEAAVAGNLQTLVGRFSNGEVWSAEFLPHGGAPFAMAGLGAVALLGVRTRSAGGRRRVLLLALTMFAPCFYYTFLWNRLRYLWPFAPGGSSGSRASRASSATCSARCGRDGASRRPSLCGVFVGDPRDEARVDARRRRPVGERHRPAAGGARALGEGQPPAGRAHRRERHRRHRLLRRARRRSTSSASRPRARRATGSPAPPRASSTTSGCARTRAAGCRRTSSSTRSGWACPMVLGEPLHEATVTDATILGGADDARLRGRLVAARHGRERRGRASRRASAIVDALDVADLESEAAHGYALLGAARGRGDRARGRSHAGRRRRSSTAAGRDARSSGSSRTCVPGVPGAVHRALRGAPADARVRGARRRRPARGFDVGDADDWVGARLRRPRRASPESAPRSSCAPPAGPDDVPLLVRRRWLTRHCGVNISG